MNNLLERERNLREANEALVRENHALKANWQYYEAELRRQQPYVLQLQHQVRALESEVRELRRRSSVDSGAAAAADSLRTKYTRVKNENEGLRQTVRHLKGKVHEAIDQRVRRLNEEIRRWSRRCDDMENRYGRVRAGMDVASARCEDLEVDNAELRRELAAYERVLRRHRLL